MKPLIRITQLLVCLVVLFFGGSCHSDNEAPLYREYQLPADCRLENIEEDKALVINSEAEFREVFADYPDVSPVNFKTSTLLLVRGTSNYGIQEIEPLISKTDNSQYIFEIIVKQNNTTVVQSWQLSYLIPKTNPENITLTIAYIEPVW